MKKKLFSLITTLAMTISLSGALPAMAWEYGEGYSWLVGADNPSDIVATLKLSDPKNGHSKGEMIIEGTGDMEDFSSGDIPWVWYLEQITSVKISEGITSIGARSFDSSFINTDYYGGVSNLTSVTFPSTLKSIGMCAFAECKLLTSIDLPDGLIEIGVGSFMDCTGLTNVVIPDSVTRILDAFANCTSLSSVTIPDINAAYLSTNIFDNCSSDLTVYCYGGGKVEQVLKHDGINYEILGKSKYAINKSELEKAIADGYEFDRSKYTIETSEVLLSAIVEGEMVFKDWNSTQEKVDEAVQAIRDAINNLVEKSSETPSNPSQTDPSNTSSNPSSDNSSDNLAQSSTNTTPKSPSTAPTAVSPSKTTRSAAKVEKDKKNAETVMNQAKLTKLSVKSKAKKKITVSWKKVSKAKGYQVQVSTNKKFKKSKIILTKNTKNKKLIIKNSKIKSKKTYYVRVRAYSTYKDTNNVTQKVYSKWNKKLRKVKVK